MWGEVPAGEISPASSMRSGLTPDWDCSGMGCPVSCAAQAATVIEGITLTAHMYCCEVSHPCVRQVHGKATCDMCIILSELA